MPVLKLVMLLPSTKKGLFSSKKVSNAVRFTTEGSASTCPKSGLTVRSSVMSLVIPNLASSPPLIFQLVPVAKGLPSTFSNFSRLPTMNGVMSACFLGLIPVRPVISPKLCTKPDAFRSTCCHIDVSLLRKSWRSTSIPQTPSSDILNLSCVRGILSSAAQPHSYIEASVYHIAIWYTDAAMYEWGLSLIHI